MIRRSLLAIPVFLASLVSIPAAAQQPDPENVLFMDLDYGRVVIELRPELAPNHVERIRALTRDGFYDGLKFHRVIEGFMAQTGDPRGDGTGGSDLPDLREEFNQARHVRGTLSMARTQNPNSANSQFFIVYAPAPFLDGEYTVWGRVIDGMEHVDKIKKGPSSRNGAVDDPDRIVRMRVAADVQ